MKWNWLWVPLLLVMLGLFLPLFDTLAVLVLILGFGWIWFLARVVPEIHVSLGGLLTAAAALACFAYGLHKLLEWLATAMGSTAAEADAEPAPRPWRVRYTTCITALIFVMFVAGISMIGMTHQIAWMATSKEPMMAMRGLENARRTESMSNMWQIGVGLSHYHKVHGSFPAGATTDAEGRPLHSWQTALLPFVEENALYQQIDRTKPWIDPVNAAAFGNTPRVFRNPSADRAMGYEYKDKAGYGLSHYAGNAQTLGGTEPISRTQIPDGASHTILAGEAAGNFKAWGQPGNWRDAELGVDRSLDGFGGNRPLTTIFLFGDGSVKTLNNDIDPALFRALCTPAGRERLPDKWDE